MTSLPTSCSGRAFVHEGVTYYSPNSLHVVKPPNRLNDHHYRFAYQDCFFDRFTSPQFWSPVYGWIAFLPTRPTFDKCKIFECLDKTRAVPVSSSMWSLDEVILAKWIALEDCLFDMSVKIAKRFGIHGFLKPSPIISLKPLTPRHNLVCADEQVLRIRDWLVMWMGLLSYSIAKAESIASNQTNPWSWKIEMVEEQIPQTIVDEITQSFICDFSAQCPRAGVFLDPLDPTHPPVEFFTKFNVPVWYIWSPAHATALQSQGTPRHLLPSEAEILRAQSILPSDFSQMDSALTRSTHRSYLHQQNPLPTPVTKGSRKAVHQSEYDVRLQAYIDTKPWEKFFNERAKTIAEIQKTETPKERLVRKNRKAKPPIARNTKGFLWELSDEEDVIELVRRQVSLAELKDLVTEPGPNVRYCPYFNQWDICIYFGADSASARAEILRCAEFEDEMNNAPPISFTSTLLTPPPPENDQLAHHEQLNSLRSCSGSLRTLLSDLLTNVTMPEAMVWKNEDVLSCLYFRHGFILPASKKEPTDNDVKDWQNAMGCLSRDKSTPIESAKGFHREISDFVNLLKSEKTPNPSRWDLAPSQPHTISRDKFWELFERKGGWLVLTRDIFEECEVDSWQIAIEHLVDAAFIYRILLHDPTGNRITRASIIGRMIDLCIPFRTLDSTHGIHCVLNISRSIPTRRENHIFSVIEYENYVNIRHHLLQSDRGRAALMEGGIVSRLAQDHIGVEHALTGPSFAVYDRNIGQCYEDDRGKHYVDDGLTSAELDVICGVYHMHCSSGRYQTEAHVSWWPPYHLWKNAKLNGTNPGYWTDINEAWYTKRLNGILAGTEQPLNSSKWRQHLKGLKHCVRFAESTKVATTTLLR